MFNIDVLLTHAMQAPDKFVGLGPNVIERRKSHKMVEVGRLENKNFSCLLFCVLWIGDNLKMEMR